MRVLVLGSGAKDHAMTWWLSKSCFISGLFVARGNYCTPDIAEKLKDVDPSDGESVYLACIRHAIDLVFVGTEAPLLTGVIEYLNERGIKTFGAPSKSIKLEDDKAFSRSFTDRHNIPTPRRSLFADIEHMRKYLERHKGKNFIVKSNNISPSRETLSSCDTEKLLSYAKRLLQKGPVFLEEYIPGLPITATILLDNKHYLPLPIVSEYTRRMEGDDIPTGGMGAICPVPISEDTALAIKERIIDPTLYGMKVEQLSYRGVLTLSIIIKEDMQPVLVDYHVRFNDPAAQAFVPLIENDLLDILMAMGSDELDRIKLTTSEDFTVAVVLASEGYPLESITGRRIVGLTHIRRTGTDKLPLIFCGAVDEDENGNPVTTGGRAVTVVGKAKSLEEANKKAYRTMAGLKLEGGWFRNDIGNRFFQS